MAEAIVRAALPLVTTTTTGTAMLAEGIAAGPFLVEGGTAGTAAGKGDYYYDDAKKILHIQSSTPLILSTPSQTDATIDIDAGVKADLVLDGVDIKTAARSPINMITNSDEDGDGQKVQYANQITNKTMLYLTIADRSDNKLIYTEMTQNGWPGIRCGWGSILVIDDSVANIRLGGSKFSLEDIVEPVDGLVGADVTLANGTTLAEGDPLSRLDSEQCGTLTVQSGAQSAGIGSGPHEDAGTIVINGGDIEASQPVIISGDLSNSAGIGGGEGGSGTIITINGGRVLAKAGWCGAAIGAGRGYPNSCVAKDDAIEVPKGTAASNHPYGWNDSGHFNTVAGDITINGGFIDARNGGHGNAIGQSCAHGRTSNKSHVIRITGGTVLTTVTALSNPPKMYEIGASSGYTIITGGSVLVSNKSMFQGIGDTAYNTQGITNWNDVISIAGGDPNDPTASKRKYLPDKDKVTMITVDLGADLRANNEAAGLPNDTPLDNLIVDWDLSLASEHYSYGAPAQFHDGKLYLWLPEDEVSKKQISVTLKYLDKNGSVQEVLPLFREPGQSGDLLKRYLDFQITDQGYLNSLNKYYDGLPLASYDLAAGPITTPPPDNKTLDRVADESGRPLIKYSYQPYDKKPSSPNDDSPRPIGPETSETVTDESGNEVTTLPANAGLAKFTMVSKQYADEESSDEDVRDFAKSYWGHRATGWLEIKPIASVVTDLTAEWADEAEGSDQRPGSAEHSADQVLKVSATIDRAKTVDGKAGSEATKPTCAAPEGRVQLYVDGEPVGSPIELLFEDKTVPDSPTRASRAVVPANAQRVDNGEGGSYTRFEYSFKPSETDYLVPEVGEVGRHEISLKFLPPSDDQRAEGVPANYLESADPTESPEVPRDTVAIDPIDPNPAVTGGKDPDCTDPDAPEPKVETSPGEPADPDADPDKPGDKVFRGSVTTTWGEASEANPHPGRVVLKVRTPSSGAIEVTDEKGSVFKAEFKKGDDGLPVKDNDGCYTLVIDPTAIGTGQLTFVQKPNGAYTGSTWIYSVTVRPDASVAPAPKLVKKAENLTHPDGPTQPGDRVRYTITASNGAAGSLWTQVVVSDPLPACLDVAGATVRLVGADGVERTLSAAAPGAAPAAGQYALSAVGADGRRVLEAPVGDIGGGRAAALSIECAVRVDIDFAAAANESLSLENVAEATGKRPNPDDPDGPDVGPVDPDPSDPAAPPGPEEVLPADPDMRVGKTVENAGDPGAEVTRVGDVLRYTVTLENAGATNSCLASAVISDPLPAGLEPVAGTLRLSVGDGEPVAVPDATYNAASRTIAVAVGDLWGGDSATLTFQATVGEAALGSDIANVAFSHGRVPSQSAEELPEAPDPGEPVDPPAGEPVAKSDPASPAPVVGNDPEEGDVSVGKTAENTSRGDGTTRVGDTVRYEITLRNEGAGTSWMDAVIRDDVPEGLEPVSGTIRLRLPGGAEAAVDDAAYDPATRVLAVAVGHLHGGQEAVLRFDALVTGAAVGADIGNVAVGYGAPPSRWDPDGESPEPGAPLDPPGGWDSWEEGRGKVVSDPAYPPGVDRLGGVVAGDLPGDKRRATIAHKLAQTGDALATAAGTALAGALAAAALALATRRRRRAQ